MTELHFKSDTKYRKKFFTPDSFAHPAKMHSQLLIWLVEHYTKPGEVILDPMAGMGTTMLACTLGRSCMLVELERKFVLMMEGGECNGFECANCDLREQWKVITIEEQFLELADKYFPKNKQLIHAFEQHGWEWTKNQILKRYPSDAHHIVGNWEQVKQRPQMPQLGGEIGTCQIIQGDARNLEGLLADKIITSPPYADIEKRDRSKESWWDEEREKKLSGGSTKIAKGYQADKIITSPPYAETVHHTDDPKYSEKYRPGRSHHLAGTAGQGEDNIGHLPYGDIDKIITSPPYAERHSYPDVERERKAVEKLKAHPNSQIGGVRIHEHCSDNPQNIGNKPYGDIDSIITSPPYESGGHHNGVFQTWGGGHAEGAVGQAAGEQKEHGYGDSQNNIGNLKSDTYLEAMLQVYQQCFKVLKDGGLMILVTKNFIRNKQVVRLDTDTIRLCQEAGFSCVERHRRRLPSQSFWRVIYQKKFPDVEQIKHEDILVFQRA